MFVEITAGTYGYRDKHGFLKPKSEGTVIELDDAEAKRIIGLKIAKEVPAPAQETPLPALKDDSAGDKLPFEEEPRNEADNDDAEEEGMAVESMNVPQLRAVAKQLGIKNTDKMNKQALLDAIGVAGEDPAMPEG